MKKEPKLLKQKAVNSLTLCVDHFNRTSDTGRVEAVLHFLDHSFEMLLKASILHCGGKIRDRGEKNTIGFDTCVRRALSDGNFEGAKRGMEKLGRGESERECYYALPFRPGEFAGKQFPQSHRRPRTRFGEITERRECLPRTGL